MKIVFLVYEFKKSHWSQNLQKWSNLTLTWLISKLTKSRSGLTKVNLTKLMKFLRIWGNLCSVSKVEKLNASIVWCLYFSLCVIKICRNFKKTCFWARKCIEISLLWWHMRKIMKWNELVTSVKNTGFLGMNFWKCKNLCFFSFYPENYLTL